MSSQPNIQFDKSQRPQALRSESDYLQSQKSSPLLGHHQGFQEPSGNAPSIMVHGSDPQLPLYNSQSTSNLPTTSRPLVASINTAPAGVPSILEQQQSASAGPSGPYGPGRSTAYTGSHSHSRSSPAGMDQRYVPFASPTTDKYVPPPGQRFPNVAMSPMSGPSTAPLELSDIRPRADTNMSAYSYDAAAMVAPSCGYVTPWPLFAYDWCKWPIPQNSSSAGRMAVGSHLEDGHNYINVLDTRITSASSDDMPMSPNPANPTIEYTKIAEATHSYPVTRMMWEPPSSQKQSHDLLATSGDHLRLWSLGNNQSQANPSNSITSRGTSQAPPQKLALLALLSNSKTPEHTAPLTSLDWNSVSPSLIITSSIDTTCTIWDIPSLTAKTQLIAHDKEVYDVRFCANSVDIFVSCGADGSVRMFDLRSLEHSTIIYEPSNKSDKDGKRILRSIRYGTNGS
jgi:WD repeat-containing protein 68